MDIFAHLLWAHAMARGGNKTLEKKHKRKMSLSWTSFFGIFPDLFAFTIPFATFIVAFLSGDIPAGLPGRDLASTLYQYSHSIVIWVVVFLAVWAFFRRPRFELLGWFLHILIDIPTHKIEFYPTPFLFPISEYRFPLGISWSEPWFMIVNYSLLFIVFFLIFYSRRTGTTGR